VGLHLSADYSVKPFSVWWSDKRIDYKLETPWGKEAFDMLPAATIVRIINSRYWEAKELVSFILRQVRPCTYRMAAWWRFVTIQ